jgi:translation elongation factor EF-4
MVFAGVFPLDATDFTKLEEAIGRVSTRLPAATGGWLTDHVAHVS